MEQLASEYGPDELVLIEYFLSSDFVVSDGQKRAFQDYSVAYTPTVYFNGPQNPVGPASYSKYKSRVDLEREKVTPVILTAESIVLGNQLAIDAEAHNTGENNLSDLEVWFAASEDMGSPETHYVLRALESLGTIDSLPAGETKSYSHSFDLPESNMSNVQAIVFMQSTQSSSREVIQTAIV